MALVSWIGMAAACGWETRAFVDDWFFAQGPVPPTNSLAGWQPVTLPHTWNAADALDGGGSDVQSRDGYYRGPGWYRKAFVPGANLEGKRVFLRFEGVGSVADVYVNGVHLGQHRGAFGAFCFELTDTLNFGGTNLITVRADNAWRSDVAPLSGDFPIFGGIYRPVWLLVREAACITPLDHGSPGVFITQESVSRDQASVSVLTKIDHAGNHAVLELDCVIKDADGKVLGRNTRPVHVERTAEVRQAFTLAKPRLWHGRVDPYLHTVEVTLRDGGRVLDRAVQPLGLRFFRVDPERGFFLNDEPYRLYGVNRHQDRADKGWAVSDADHEEDIRLIGEMGARAVRLAHYPHASRVYELCDQAGLMVWAELPLVDCVSAGPEFAANARQQLLELIRQHYNHPSIFAWSLFNEMYHRDSAEALPLLKDLHALAKQEDPGRYTTCASNKRRADLCTVTDLLAFNAYPGWYGGGPEAMNQPLSVYHELGGRRGVGVGEYGAGGSIRHHQQNPPQPVPISQWHPEEWQALVHEGNYATIRDTGYCWGSFVWNMFDFASTWRNEGDAPGINDKGLVTYDRQTRKDAFYFYQANWSDQPVLHLTSRRHVDRDEATTPVKVYSNAREVTLFVNDAALGARVVDELNIALWESVRLSPGANRIRVEARFGDQVLTDACVWNLRPKAAAALDGGAPQE